MSVYLVVMAIAGIAALLSLVRTKSVLHPLEAAALFMAASVIVQQSFVIVAFCLRWKEATDEGVGFWMLAVNRDVLMPALFVWLVRIGADARLSLAARVTAGALGFGVWTGVEALLAKLGLIRFVRWPFAYSILEWMTIAGAVFAMYAVCRHLIRKACVRHDFVSGRRL
ncbi:hypothetical protein [Paenibacillus flagellatus]|uniref:hypothetical protein n=1 Tax=Paenibacillus flagellatus TaxID=2211139 RepID=UPI0013053C95|nr:hypothetical protein [Paenibacillus flagellatus]